MANNEHGDFQTNPLLAQRVIARVLQVAGKPATIIEPTCGRGNFIKASLDGFPGAIVHGLEVQPGYVAELERRFQFNARFVLHNANYFDFDWTGLVGAVRKPVWVIGNPPWITNSLLTKLNSSNVPRKSPQLHLRGIEAQTGKSNFDISESMLRDWFQWCSSCDGTLAVICKMSVARKVLHWWWKRAEATPKSSMHLIDAAEEFGASVAACVLVCTFGSNGTNGKTCDVFDTLEGVVPHQTFGFADGHIVADALAYRRGRIMLGVAAPRWRSGIKHDASQALELTRVRGHLTNKRGERIDLEEDFIFPLMKGSDLVQPDGYRGRTIIVPQRTIGDDTAHIEQAAPKTWAYLNANLDIFARRKSVIYRKGGPFAIFGIGTYSFAPFKIAIGALYKTLQFQLVGPVNGKPVMFDDTVYFLGFDDEQIARRIIDKLRASEVDDFLRSMIFWDDMRPVKTDILNRVNLQAT